MQSVDLKLTMKRVDLYRNGTERNPDLPLDTHVFTFHFLLFNSQLFKSTTEWNYCHIIIHRVRLVRPSSIHPSIHPLKQSEPFPVQTTFILLLFRCYCYSTNRHSSGTTSFMHFQPHPNLMATQP